MPLLVTGWRKSGSCSPNLSSLTVVMVSVPRIRCTNSDVTQAGWLEGASSSTGVASVTATQPEPDPFLCGGGFGQAGVTHGSFSGLRPPPWLVSEQDEPGDVLASSSQLPRRARSDPGAVGDVGDSSRGPALLVCL